MNLGAETKSLPLLSFRGVTTEPTAAYDVPIWGVDFNLFPGELLLVRLERGHLRVPLADVALGLLEPLQGKVLFKGESWSQLPAERAAELRGRCGRVFAGHGWCNELAISDNITLAQRHHSLRSEAEIETEAANLARYFGLPGLPLGAPARTREGDLGRAGLVRAFLGRPELLLLEQPAQNLFPEILPALLNALRAARERGAAVIWLTNEPRVWQEQGVRATLRGTLFGSRMQLGAEEE